MADSRNHKPAKPVGSGPFITYCQWVWDELSKRYEDTDTVKWNVTTRGISSTAKTNLAGASPVCPFQIYRTETWLKFKVATGYVITTGAPFVPTDVGTEFTLTSGVAKYYFLLTMSSATAAVISVSDTLPVWSVEIVPIGWVDTNTYSGASRSVIYQFCNENIFSPCVVAA